jgi:hypothetical protein
MKDVLIEELRLSRSRALVDIWSGELSWRTWEGRADLGFGPNGGELMPICHFRCRKREGNNENEIEKVDMI